MFARIVNSDMYVPIAVNILRIPVMCYQNLQNALKILIRQDGKINFIFNLQYSTF